MSRSIVDHMMKVKMAKRFLDSSGESGFSFGNESNGEIGLPTSHMQARTLYLIQLVSWLKNCL